MSHHKEKEKEEHEDEQSTYWVESREPVVMLVFILPFLLFYEWGLIQFGGSNPDSLRNGADYWMRGFLAQAGIDQSIVLPAIVTLILIGWQTVQQRPWRTPPGTLVGMMAESILWAQVLIGLGRLQDLAHDRIEKLVAVTAPATSEVNWGRTVSFVGAGIYEEVLFRLCLLPVIYLLFRALLMPKVIARLGGVLLSSAAFAAAHYVGPNAEAFDPYTCGFRAMAGVFFSILFLWRGFGITVGCHAAYDILVGVLLAQ